MTSRFPATRSVTHAHRLPGVIVDSLSDIVRVTLLSGQETFRLVAPMLTAKVNLARWVMAPKVSPTS